MNKHIAIAIPLKKKISTHKTQDEAEHRLPIENVLKFHNRVENKHS